MQRSPGDYSAGTIEGQIGQPVITGTNTNWTSTDQTGTVSYQVAKYDELVMPGQRSLAILSVDGVGQLTLNEALPFAIPAGSTYTIIRRTPVVSSAVLGAIQGLLRLGTDASPDPARTLDNGVSRLKIDFDKSGKIRFRVGATGADDSPGHTYATALLIDPATGAVSAEGLTGGAQASTFNQIFNVVGKPPDNLGQPGDYAFDTTTGFVFYGPKALASWPPGIDVLANVAAAKDSAATAAKAAAEAKQALAAVPAAAAAATQPGVDAAAQSAADAKKALAAVPGAAAAATQPAVDAAAQSAADAKQALTTMRSSIADATTTATQNAVDHATANARQTITTATATVAGYVAQLQGRVFDFNLSIDPQVQVYAGGFDWNNNV